MAGPVIDDSHSPVLRVVGILAGVAVALALVVGLVLVVVSTDEDEGSDDTEETTEVTTDGPDEDPFDDFSDDFSDDVSDDGEGPPGDSGDSEDEGDGAEVDLLRDDPRPAVDAWIEVAGDGAEALEVYLYPTYGFADVVDRPDILRYGWRDGMVQGPDRDEPFPGTDLDAEAFRLTRPNWDALPGLVAGAPQWAGIPGGAVSHVIVTSDRPFSDRFLFRIYVVGDDASDYVVATLDGRPAQR